MSTCPRSWQSADSLLDHGTGGGEVLRQLGPLPRRCVATESYPPMVAAAASNLHPLGVQVVVTSSQTHNVEGRQNGEYPERRLPFPDDSFDIVLGRHVAFHGPEMARLVRPGGQFIADHGVLEPGSSWYPPGWSPIEAVEGTPEFEIIDVKRCRMVTTFKDVGAYAYHLKNSPSPTPFSLDCWRDRLWSIHLQIVERGSWTSRVGGEPVQLVRARRR